MVGQFEMVESNCQEHAYTSTTIRETTANGSQLATLFSNEVSLKLASLHTHNPVSLPFCFNLRMCISVNISNLIRIHEILTGSIGIIFEH